MTRVQIEKLTALRAALAVLETLSGSVVNDTDTRDIRIQLRTAIKDATPRGEREDLL